MRDKLVYLGAMAVSGAVLAGLLGWLLVRALARAGALLGVPGRAGAPGARTLSDRRPRARVEVAGLTWRPFGRREPVLRDLTLDLRRGERVLLAGPCGSGKSTLLRALAGLLETADAG